MSSGNPEQERRLRAQEFMERKLGHGIHKDNEVFVSMSVFAAEEVALAVPLAEVEERRRVMMTLASALQKFAPEAMEIVVTKLHGIDAAYEEFLKFLADGR